MEPLIKFLNLFFLGIMTRPTRKLIKTDRGYAPYANKTLLYSVLTGLGFAIILPPLGIPAWVAGYVYWSKRHFKEYLEGPESYEQQQVLQGVIEHQNMLEEKRSIRKHEKFLSRLDSLDSIRGPNHKEEKEIDYSKFP